MYNWNTLHSIPVLEYFKVGSQNLSPSGRFGRVFEGLFIHSFVTLNKFFMNNERRDITNFDEGKLMLNKISITFQFGTA